MIVWHSSAIAAGESPLDAYYKQQAKGDAPPPPIDNDQYYVAPGQYIDYQHSARSAAPPAVKPSINCNSIGDAPSCISD